MSVHLLHVEVQSSRLHQICHAPSVLLLGGTLLGAQEQVCHLRSLRQGERMHVIRMSHSYKAGQGLSDPELNFTS